jgi:hypothetical protein
MDLTESSPLQAKASTRETADRLKIDYETLLRYKRAEEQGPFVEGRDFIFVGLGKKKLLWDCAQAEQSLWSWKRETAAEVETFGRDPAPQAH